MRNLWSQTTRQPICDETIQNNHYPGDRGFLRLYFNFEQNNYLSKGNYISGRNITIVKIYFASCFTNFSVCFSLSDHAEEMLKKIGKRRLK